MSVAIRLASLADEQNQLIEILDRNLPGRPNREIHKRRYANPLGPGWSWIAHLPSSDTIVAMASVFPRPFWVNGKQVICGQVVEFAVEAAYRSLGPAVLLQKATFEPVNSGEAAFGYDCPPHDRGMSTFIRLGMQASCEVVRYARLFRSDEYLANRLGTGAWTRPLVATANLALQIRRSARPAQGLEICRHDRPFDEEFSQLDRLTSSADTVRAGRAAEELNWRYLADPFAPPGSAKANMGRHRVFTARQSGELVAFAILFTQEDGVACIADLFGRNLGDFGGALLEAIVDVCRQDKLTRLDGLCSADGGLRLFFEHAGFQARERVYRVVAYESAGRTSRLLNSDLHWTFTNFEVS